MQLQTQGVLLNSVGIGEEVSNNSRGAAKLSLDDKFSSAALNKSSVAAAGIGGGALQASVNSLSKDQRQL